MFGYLYYPLTVKIDKRRMHVYDIVCFMRYFVVSWKEKGGTKMKVVRFSKPLYQVE